MMKAVQCQQEECAAILLEHGADPDLVDTDGNTPLYYAVWGHNAAIVAKLLGHNADVEARNKDDLTPLLLALSENKQQMVELLGRREGNRHAVDNIIRITLLVQIPQPSW
ncbi:putative ankyrin repeat domain-containing protein 19 isoform X2 [Talpa occidentalis]|uniref:putative ankyrin repeat domain-containing protein 19 isoform X2 n=1 Tax=Talpa occidentalis TaxID=50954 RepID=UPI0023F65AD3|nr:putative ankyrin repeat domain-containing protein 19 isoform X2 [Talpa occidentalis]